MGMRLTLIDCLDLLPEDFVIDKRKSVSHPLSVDVTALVRVVESRLETEILSIKAGLDELLGDVKSDALWKVKEAVGRMYWTDAMRGKEGDLHQEVDHG